MKFYLISPPESHINFSPESLDKISDIIPIDYFQFRPKHEHLGERLKFVKEYFYDISKICKSKKINLIINNDFEIARKFPFDGIHLGQGDKKCSDAKEKFGKKFIVGVSCSDSVELYYEAEKQKADYVAFGPVFESITKKKNTINIQKTLTSINNLRLPFTLIGGINHSNFMQLHRFQPRNIAIISCFWNYCKGPYQSALLFKKIMDNKVK